MTHARAPLHAASSASTSKAVTAHSEGSNPSCAAPKVKSGFPAVRNLVDAINALPARDKSQDAKMAEFVMQSLAQENGFKGLWTPEERAVGAAFITLKLGPRAAHYGWRLYKRYRSTGSWDASAVGY